MRVDCVAKQRRLGPPHVGRPDTETMTTESARRARSANGTKRRAVLSPRISRATVYAVLGLVGSARVGIPLASGRRENLGGVPN